MRGPRGELADVTALALLPEASRPGSAFRESFFRNAHQQQDQLVASLRASFQAELLLTWELLLGRRAVDSKDWSQMPDELRGLYTHAARLCGRGRGLDATAQDNLAVAGEGAVDWLRYAEQMRVFMTPEHADHINRGSFPEHLFDLQPAFGKDRAGSFDPVRGYVGVDGQSPSLGPVNGPYPIKDGEKARATIAILDQLLAAAHPLVRSPAVPRLHPLQPARRLPPPGRLPSAYGNMQRKRGLRRVPEGDNTASTGGRPLGGSQHESAAGVLDAVGRISHRPGALSTYPAMRRAQKDPAREVTLTSRQIAPHRDVAVGKTLRPRAGCRRGRALEGAQGEGGGEASLLI